MMSFTEPAIVKIRRGDFSTSPSANQLDNFKSGDVPTPFQTATAAGVIDQQVFKSGVGLFALHTETASTSNGCFNLANYILPNDQKLTLGLDALGESVSGHPRVTSPSDQALKQLIASVDKTKYPSFLLLTTPNGQELRAVQKIATDLTAEQRLANIPLVFRFGGNNFKYLNGRAA